MKPLAVRRSLVEVGFSRVSPLLEQVKPQQCNSATQAVEPLPKKNQRPETPLTPWAVVSRYSRAGDSTNQCGCPPPPPPFSRGGREALGRGREGGGGWGEVECGGRDELVEEGKGKLEGGEGERRRREGGEGRAEADSGRVREEVYVERGERREKGGCGTDARREEKRRGATRERGRGRRGRERREGGRALDGVRASRAQPERAEREPSSRVGGEKEERRGPPARALVDSRERG